MKFIGLFQDPQMDRESAVIINIGGGIWDIPSGIPAQYPDWPAVSEWSDRYPAGVMSHPHAKSVLYSDEVWKYSVMSHIWTNSIFFSFSVCIQVCIWAASIVFPRAFLSPQATHFTENSSACRSGVCPVLDCNYIFLTQVCHSRRLGPSWTCFWKEFCFIVWRGECLASVWSEETLTELVSRWVCLTPIHNESLLQLDEVSLSCS